MPFCRECGKAVEKDWKSCPYCSCQIDSSTKVQISDNSGNNSELKITPENSINKPIVFGAIGCAGIIVLAVMLLGSHPGEIQYTATSSYSLNVWFNGGDTMNLEDIEIKAYADGRGEICKNRHNEDYDWNDDCHYDLDDDWPPGDELRLNIDCWYLSNNYCHVQLEIRYKGDLLSGSNKEITLLR